MLHIPQKSVYDYLLSPWQQLATTYNLNIMYHNYYQRKLKINVLHVRIGACSYRSGVSTFTFAGVAVNIVPHHRGSCLWPCSVLWIHAGEKRKTERERGREGERDIDG